MTIAGTVDLTPNYPFMFRRFANELPTTGQQLIKNPTLENVHEFFVPLCVAMECAYTPAQIEELRDIFSQLLVDVSKARGY